MVPAVTISSMLNPDDKEVNGRASGALRSILEDAIRSYLTNMKCSTSNEIGAVRIYWKLLETMCVGRKLTKHTSSRDRLNTREAGVVLCGLHLP